MKPLWPDLTRTIAAIHDQHAQWAATAGEQITVPRGGAKHDGHPTLAAPCHCHKPIRDDGTCIRCGHSTL